MENLFISPTKYSPEIAFDSISNHLEIKGESYPENTAAFYAPVFGWLEEYLAQIGGQEMTLNLEMHYFNSSSSKILLDLFDILDLSVKAGRKIVVNWIYDKENDNALEYGEEFREDLQWLPFNLVEKAYK